MVRVDARENRDRILAVARESLKASDEVSLNRIAQRAGVGAGTLYRHFPTREALVLAVYQEEVDRLVGSVPGLLADRAPVEALRAWTLELVAAMRRKHGLGDAIGDAAHQTVSAQTYGPVVGAIAALLDAGKADSTIRADANAADFLMLTGSLWRAVGHGEADPGRMLDVILDGLRA